MRFRDSAVVGTVMGITGVAAVLSTLGHAWIEHSQYLLLAAGTIVIGIPHGAADNHICQDVMRRCHAKWFYGLYILAAAAYGALWVAAPSFALVLFLAISVYHFGQSNLFYLRLPEGALLKKAVYLVWGSFYLVPPILYQYEEARLVITTLLGFDPITAATAQTLAPVVSGLLLSVMAGAVLLFRVARVMTTGEVVREVVSVAVLYSLYVTAPLYVSFIVYWAFWHSLNSALEITTLWERGRLRKQIRAFVRKTLPLTLVTFAGMALIFAMAGAYGSRASLIAVFFVIIAAVTLPHMVIMEAYYRREYASRTLG